MGGGGMCVLADTSRALKPARIRRSSFEGCGAELVGGALLFEGVHLVLLEDSTVLVDNKARRLTPHATHFERAYLHWPTIRLHSAPPFSGRASSRIDSLCHLAGGCRSEVASSTAKPARLRQSGTLRIPL